MLEAPGGVVHGLYFPGDTVNENINVLIDCVTVNNGYSDRLYRRFRLQFSKVLIVSYFIRLHCFGTRAPQHVFAAIISGAIRPR